MNHTGAVWAGYWRQKADPKVFKSFLYHPPEINPLIHSAVVPEQKLIIFAVEFIIWGEGDHRGWDGWMASLTPWTWVWVNSGSWWWTGRPGVLLFMGSQSQTRLSDCSDLNGNPLQCSCLESPRDKGAWWAAVCGVTQSRTWLKWLSSSSSKRAKWFFLT